MCYKDNERAKNEQRVEKSPFAANILGRNYWQRLFLGTGYVLEKAGPAAILSYLLGGAIVLCVMLCLAELAVAEPIAGSFVTYARKYIGPTWACGVGWTYWMTWVSYVPSE